MSSDACIVRRPAVAPCRLAMIFAPSPSGLAGGGYHLVTAHGHLRSPRSPARYLEAMAGQQPRTLDEFAALPGVGEKKIEHYAATFIAMVAGHT